MIKSIGFLSMQFEEEEKRDFRPSFFGKLKSIGNPILLDETYGAKLGYSKHDYLGANPSIRFCSRSEVLRSDIVSSVRTPINDELLQMKRGATLFSMLHFVTRRNRNVMLQDLGVRMYAMDSVVDDFGLRMIQDFPGTVRSALLSGFNLLDVDALHGLCRILIIGTGELGKLAVDYAVKLAPAPAIVTSVGRSMTDDRIEMIKLLSNTDMIIDSSKRTETHKHIIDNDMLGSLPEHAVIVDISADDYDTSVNPIQVKGIEGIPTGNLHRYLFETDDPAYDMIPAGVRSKNRRRLVSCNAWPGMDADHCLDRYEKQIEPFIRILARYESFDNSDDPYIRALNRSSFDEFNRELTK